MEKNSNGLIITIIILVIALVGMSIYMVYDKNNNLSTTKECTQTDKENTNTPNKQEELKEENKTNLPKCYGTYYGESSEQIDDVISYDLKVKYILKKDGTFEADFSGVSGTRGVYTINDNTISLTGLKETVGPRDEDPYYVTSDYIIADDCSYILYNPNNTHSFKLNKID